MKTTLQIQIIPIDSGISVTGPYNSQNNIAYRLAGGQYDKQGRRWILPNTNDNWAMLNERFGSDSSTVIAVVESSDLATKDSQIVIGGYLIAYWDTRYCCIRVAEGVVFAEGSWNETTSFMDQAPCLASPDARFHVSVRRDFAMKNGLKIIEELDE